MALAHNSDSPHLEYTAKQNKTTVSVFSLNSYDRDFLKALSCC